MKIYTYEGAPNPRRLAMFMQYKGIAIDTELVDMVNAQQLSDEDIADLSAWYSAIIIEVIVPETQ